MSVMLFHQTDDSFFDILEAQAQAAYQAACTFLMLADHFDQMPEYLERLEALEHDADRLTHGFVNKVNTQFTTPFDKEDLRALTDKLDDITDSIEATAGRMAAYRLQTRRPDLLVLGGLLVAVTQETLAMTQLLRHGFGNTELPEVIAGIHAMESRSDREFRKALSDLFADDDLDVRTLIKWKEIYERIEYSVNRCEKLAGFVESLMVKYKLRR
jgi:uncharacterized protein Yka (UPF0111/DUF47 family)